MSETAPAVVPDPVPTPMEKPPANKRGKKPSVLTGVSRKAPSPSVSKLITEALSASQERAGMSLAALKKALAAAGYNVEKNNSRIKLGLKTLVSKGTLVQTKGTGASGSFKLNKKVAPEPAKGKDKRPPSSKTKKVVLSRDSKPAKNANTNKRAQKPRAAEAKKVTRSGRKAKGPQSKQQHKSPVNAKAVKPKAAKPNLAQQKTKPRKAASKK